MMQPSGGVPVAVIEDDCPVVHIGVWHPRPTATQHKHSEPSMRARLAVALCGELRNRHNLPVPMRGKA